MKVRLNLLLILKALCLAILITFGLILIVTFILRFTDLRETKLPMLNNIILILSIVSSSLYLITRTREKGWLYGASLGFLYYLLIIIVNLLFSRFDILQPISLVKLVLAMIIGAIGGIIGINLL
ncbi:MAG TPA: TIGR04086 family membrane protein [Tissierellaceae bacterium]|nr:TIGR04086 family membrane protein [Tissierellaceae bacterium]